MKERKCANLASLMVVALCFTVMGQSRGFPQQASIRPPDDPSQVTIPSRPAGSLFKGEQGKQRSEIRFAPSSRTVTIWLRVEDPKGYFIPNIRPQNFAVYEDGVRQKNVTVDIDYAPVSIALLMEFGGRYHELNETLAGQVAQAGRELLDVIGPKDKVAVFTYATKLKTICDFNQGRENLDSVFNHLGTPGLSEANLYDALLETLNRMRGVSGRKAIILISSGIDTFSKASYAQVLSAAQNSNTPIYTIGLGRFMAETAFVYGSATSFAHIDWNEAELRMEKLARASGGRAYFPETGLEIPAIYDDILENLRVRYVITYVSSNRATSGPPRQIRVELIDPQTGQPLKIHDSSGKLVAARVFVRQSYKAQG
jgi:Ca-activated chloride channel family protein